MNSTDADKNSSISIEPSSTSSQLEGSTIWGRCFKCGDQMIQGGDHSAEDLQELYGEEGAANILVSNFHCPTCESECLFYWS